MPIYCYTNDKGETVERVYRIGKQPTAISVKGQLYRRDIGAEHGGFQDTPGNWPKASFNMGNHPSQRKELATFLEAKGVPTEVNKQGDPVLRSRDHRRQVMKALGMYDRDAGYGDAAPR